MSLWVSNAETLQHDVIRSKTQANDILRQAEEPQASGQTIRNVEAKCEFLRREVEYSQQLNGVLKRIQAVTRLLADVDRASKERRVLESLRLLERQCLSQTYLLCYGSMLTEIPESWTALDQVGVSKSCRVMKLLDLRFFELKSHAHAMLDNIWKSLISFDVEAGKIVIHDALQGRHSPFFGHSPSLMLESRREESLIVLLRQHESQRRRRWAKILQRG